MLTKSRFLFPPEWLYPLGNAKAYTLTHAVKPAFFYVLISPWTRAYNRDFYTSVTALVFTSNQCVVLGSSTSPPNQRDCVTGLVKSIIDECREKIPPLHDAIALITPINGTANVDYLEQRLGPLPHIMFPTYDVSGVMYGDASLMLAPLATYLEQQRVVFHAPLVGTRRNIRAEAFTQLLDMRATCDESGDIISLSSTGPCIDLVWALAMSWHHMDHLGLSLLDPC